MKPLLLIISTILFFSCTNHKVKNFVTNETLTGNIKAVYDSFYSVDNVINATQRKICQQAVYHFDKNGKELTAFLILNIDSQSAYKTIYEFDNNGKPVKSEMLNRSGSAVINTFFKYNKNGTLIEKDDSFVSLKNKSITKYLQDARGNIIEINDSQNGETRYRYNANDFLVTAINSAISVDTTIYKYEDLDRWGNWRKRIDYQNSEKSPSAIDIRLIEYY